MRQNRAFFQLFSITITLMAAITSPQGKLSCRCHHVDLVQDYELQRFIECCREGHRTSKYLDPLSHLVNASLVAGIQLQNQFAILLLVDLASQCDDGGCFACSRGTVEQ